MINRVILIGRLGKTPETRSTQTGQAVGSFSLAVSEKWKDKSGKAQERTEWVNVVTWGNLAELCAQYLSKGSMAYVEGKLQTRNYDDKNGVKRYVTEVVANTVKFLDSKTERSEPRAAEPEPEHTQDDLPPEPGMFG